MLKKHEAFETDFTVHRDRVNDVCVNGDELIKKVLPARLHPVLSVTAEKHIPRTPDEILIIMLIWKMTAEKQKQEKSYLYVCLLQNNHHVDNISAKMAALRGKVSELERAAAQRKAKLDENSAFLQFNWKADVVESWIGTNTQQTAVPLHISPLVSKQDAACVEKISDKVSYHRKL